MSTLVAEQLKPLLQRLLTMAESHDERLARLEAVHSRLGNQLARIGEQLTKQGDQLGRIEEIAATPSPVPNVVTIPAPVPAPAPRPAPPVVVESVVNGRVAENFSRINEQITRVREQLTRMVDQLARIERVQADLRVEGAQQGQEQARLLEHLETSLTEAQDRLPDRIQRRVEALLGVAPVEIDPEPEPERVEEPVEQRSELAAVQAEVRQLGAHITELVSQLGKLGRPGNGAEPPAAPVAKPAAAAKVAARPVAGTRFAAR